MVASVEHPIEEYWLLPGDTARPIVAKLAAQAGWTPPGHVITPPELVQPGRLVSVPWTFSQGYTGLRSVHALAAVGLLW